jgi:hypothetical protein
LTLVSCRLTKEPFTIGLVMMDLRHLSNFNHKFVLNKQWTVGLNFTGNNTQIYCVLGNQFPQPNGFSVNVNVPFFFTFNGMQRIIQALEQGVLNISLKSAPEFSNQQLSFANIMDVKTISPTRAILGQNKLFVTVMTTDMKIVFPTYLGSMDIIKQNLSSVQTNMPILFSQSWAGSDKFQPMKKTPKPSTAGRRLSSDTNFFRSPTEYLAHSQPFTWSSITNLAHRYDHSKVVQAARRAFANNYYKVCLELSRSPRSSQSANLRTEFCKKIISLMVLFLAKQT